jgi:hypothetical protein
MIQSHLFHGCTSECGHPGHLERDKCLDGYCGCKCHLTVHETNVFKTICDLVFCEGGDGDIIICPTVTNFDILAKRFYSWLTFTYSWPSFQIFRSSEGVVIACGEESFMFLDPSLEDKVGRWGEEGKEFSCTQFMRLAI